MQLMSNNILLFRDAIIERKMIIFYPKYCNPLKDYGAILVTNPQFLYNSSIYCLLA